MARDRLDGALEELDALINWERKDRSGGMQRSLEPVQEILARLGDPQLAWKGVLVAGTKGKGSVCALVASGLQSAGFSVGVYASPHLEQVTERVRVDGAQVSRPELAAALEEALAARQAALADGTAGTEATWFDLMTVAAFLLFEKKQVDWAVIEAGIGGRLDSTRALDAVLSVVTNVDLEHTSTLGDTREEIAAEKGAVIAEDGHLITGIQREDESVYAVLAALAQAAGGRLVSVVQRGTFLERNLALAEAVLNELGRLGVKSTTGELLWRSFLDEEAVRRAKLPGRAEHFSVRGVPIILDSGHVASSAQILLEELERNPELGRKPKLIIALGVEKDALSVLEAFQGRVDRCFCTTAPGGRLLSEQALAQVAQDAGHDPEAWDDPGEALGEAVGDAEEGGGWVLIFGSFYLSSVLREELVRATSEDPDSRAC